MFTDTKSRKPNLPEHDLQGVGQSISKRKSDFSGCP